MIKKTIGYALFVLSVLLPVQTALLLLLTNKLGFSSAISFWKEILVGILGIVFLLQIATGLYKKTIKFSFKAFWPLIVFAGLMFLAVLDLIRIPLPLWVLGFRFELYWLGFFVISYVWIKTVLLQDKFEYRNWLANILKFGIGIGFAISSVFSILSLIIGQSKFLTFFGYGLEGNGFIISSPTGHIVDFGDDSLRLSGPFSTPNHYAGYLLLILGFLIYSLFQAKNKWYRALFASAIVLNVALILLTFARFAWLSLAILAAGIIWAWLARTLPSKIEILRSKIGLKIWSIFNTLVLATILILPVFVGLVVINLNLEKQTFLPTAIIKPNSTDLHRRHFLASVDVLLAKPNNYLIGLGLGSSGPAAKPEYGQLEKSPIVKYYYSYASKWFIDNQDLIIPENWFLQVWLNGGIVYLLAYLSIFMIPILEVIKFFKLGYHSWANLFFGFGYFGIFIGSLFLHILENQTIAFMWTLVYIFWQLIILENQSEETKKSL